MLQTSSIGLPKQGLRVANKVFTCMNQVKDTLIYGTSFLILTKFHVSEVFKLILEYSSIRRRKGNKDSILNMFLIWPTKYVGNVPIGSENPNAKYISTLN